MTLLGNSRSLAPESAAASAERRNERPTTVRQTRASGTGYTLKDADGLALFVTAQGSKSFRFSWDAKQPRISLGIYPEFSLRDSRIRRDEARNLVAKGNVRGSETQALWRV